MAADGHASDHRVIGIRRLDRRDVDVEGGEILGHHGPNLTDNVLFPLAEQAFYSFQIQGRRLDV